MSPSSCNQNNEFLREPDNIISLPATDKTLYTLGFLFNEQKTKVILITKEKPLWQKDKFNGVGGKVEPGEDPAVGMAREFLEEVDYPHEDPIWKEMGAITAPDYTVFCYAAIGRTDAISSKTSEKVVVVPVDTITPLSKDMVENLPWLIGMAYDFLEDGRPCSFTAIYPNR